MAYLLADLFHTHFSLFNVLTYNTVRAGGAALTAFFPLRSPRAVDHSPPEATQGRPVHERTMSKACTSCSKGKSGTPTMGGS